MITFIVSLLLLVLGYVLYGAFVNKVFEADPQRKTPCYTSQDGVDYMPIPTWKVFLIQFLNIAGTGPIFGAIQGILFGPGAYLWIVLGCIFGGAVHDYMSGMISIRKNGASLPELVGDELGQGARMAMRVLSLVLMILVGAVFVTTPAGLLANMIGGDSFWGQNLFWVILIFIYYLLATLLPIDKLIGRVYPVFGVALLVMAVGLVYGIFANEGGMPEITEAFSNHHPTSTMPIFPGLCITIACGAVSGFHATQSPMMARCITNEKYGRPIFYGAMITEGLVALIWAAAAIKFADSFDVTKYGMTGDEAPYEKLWALMTNGGTTGANPAVLVNVLCSTWLGKVGSVLAILGVVAAPITSGDTALRSARLIAADFMHYKQNRIYKRLLLSVPIFVISGALMFVDFSILWRYFAWFNQTLAVITLWAITVWLTRRSASEGKMKYGFLISLVPALWMTIVCSTYIFIAPEGFQLHHFVAYLLGGLLTLGALVWYIVWARKSEKLKG
ncbi:MAG: carbon starvation protein A [Bacteroidaceae bacterium]|nr:carbon starvation protein A [Bacteroidaceae bacterium]